MQNCKNSKRLSKAWSSGKKNFFKWKDKFITHILHAKEPLENSQTHINATFKCQYKIIAIEKGRQLKKNSILVNYTCKTITNWGNHLKNTS